MRYATGKSVPPIGVFIGVYVAASVITWTTNLATLIHLLLHIGPKTAESLHYVLVKTTFNAPMSFFESTDTSILLNRFSQDMSLVEVPLPVALWQLCIGE
jgi:ABC-type multidrug transport system fused ATPase/permease subunit